MTTLSENQLNSLNKEELIILISALQSQLASVQAQLESTNAMLKDSNHQLSLLTEQIHIMNHHNINKRR